MNSVRLRGALAPCVGPGRWATAALALVVAAGITCAASAASADVGYKDGVTCKAATGYFIEYEDGERELRGALCQRGKSLDCPDFSRIEFFKSGTTAHIAVTPESLRSCELAYQGHAGDVALYHTKDQLLAVAGDSLKVVQTFEGFEAPGEVHVHDDWLLVVFPKRAVLFGSIDGAFTKLGEAELADVIEVEWFDDAVVVVGKSGSARWKLGTEPSEPEVASHPAIEGAQFAVSKDGVLLAEEKGRKVRWQPFAGKAKRVSLRKNEVLLDFASSAFAAAAATTDGNIGRVISVAPNGLEDRIAIRNWELEPTDNVDAEGNPRNVLIGGDQWLMLDGGRRRPRALPIGTDDFEKWRQLKGIEFPNQGELMHVDENYVFFYMPGNKAPLRAYAMPLGEESFRIGKERFAEKVGDLVKMERITKTRYILHGKDGRQVYLNSRKRALREIELPEKGGHVEPLGRGRFIVETHKKVGKVEAVTEWKFLVPGRAVEAIDLSGAVALDGVKGGERWFGYCVPGSECDLSREVPEAPAGDVSLLTKDLEILSFERNLLNSMIAAGGALVLLLLVMAWRLDWGRGGKGIEPPAEPMQGTLSVNVSVMLAARALFDKKGRRVPLPEDMDGFVIRSSIARLPIRLVLAVVGGGVAGLAITFTRFAGEDPINLAIVGAGVAVPIASAIWVLLSWRLWNRLHLMRFGRAVEGEWVDYKGKRVAGFVAMDGVQRHIMKADPSAAIPLILHEPRRPRHAMQFVGAADVGAFPPIPAKTVGGTAGGGRPFSFLILLGLLGGLAYHGIVSFDSAFPEPLTEAQLLAVESENEGSFLKPCLDLCGDTSDEALCAQQCRGRQLNRTLTSAGVEVEGDIATPIGPRMLPIAQAAKKLVAEVTSSDASQACEELVPAFTSAVTLPPAVTSKIRQDYASVPELESEELRETAEILTKLQYDTFAPLCAPSDDCLQNPAKCEVAYPDCYGDAMKLRDAMCSYYRASLPISID